MATAATTKAAGTTATKRSSARKPKPAGHLVGYARVSTAEQDPALQLDALEEAGCARVFTDHASGSREDRPQLAAALDHVRAGDTLVVWRLDRLGRSLPHLIDTVTALADRKVGFRSVTEAVDTTTAGGRLVFHLFGALAEFERQLLRDRTLAGLAAARARSRVGGRPRVMTEAKLRLARAMRAQIPPMSLGAVATELGLTKSTVARNLRAADDTGDQR
jgi:DNA invertase Pin-like site-specific DNA recombinase